MGVLNLFNFQKETSPKGIQAPVQVKYTNTFMDTNDLGGGCKLIVLQP